MSEEEVWGERVREERLHFVGLEGRGREGRDGGVACCDVVIVNVIPVSWEEDQRLWLWVCQRCHRRRKRHGVVYVCMHVFSFPFLALFSRIYFCCLFNGLEKQRKGSDYCFTILSVFFFFWFVYLNSLSHSDVDAHLKSSTKFDCILTVIKNGQTSS